MTDAAKLARIAPWTIAAVAGLGMAFVVLYRSHASATSWGRILMIQRTDERTLRLVLDTTDAGSTDACPAPPIAVGNATAAEWESHVAGGTVEELTPTRVTLRIRMERPFAQEQSSSTSPDPSELEEPHTWSRVCLGRSRVGTPVDLCCVRYIQLWDDRFWPTEVYPVAIPPALPPSR